MKLFCYRKSTQEKIKDATFRLLAEKGYAQVTMRDIAKKAGTAVGQLTYHYKKKELLICSVIEDVANTCIDELKKRIKENKAKLRAVIDFFDEVYVMEPDMERVLVDFMTESMWNDSLKEKFNIFIEKITKLIEDIYIEYKYSTEDARLKAEFFVASISGIMSQRLLKEKSDYTIGNYRLILINEAKGEA